MVLYRMNLLRMIFKGWGMIIDVTCKRVQVFKLNGHFFWSDVFRNFNSSIGDGIHLGLIKKYSPNLKKNCRHLHKDLSPYTFQIFLMKEARPFNIINIQ